MIIPLLVGSSGDRQGEREEAISPPSQLRGFLRFAVQMSCRTQVVWLIGGIMPDKVSLCRFFFFLGGGGNGFGASPRVYEKKAGVEELHNCWKKYPEHVSVPIDQSFSSETVLPRGSL